VAEDDGEVLDDTDTDERPDNCNCGPVTVGEPLCCFACWMAGFETPADVDAEE
jgi:hypothetical protein